MRNRNKTSKLISVVFQITSVTRVVCSRNSGSAGQLETTGNFHIRIIYNLIAIPRFMALTQQCSSVIKIGLGQGIGLKRTLGRGLLGSKEFILKVIITFPREKRGNGVGAWGGWWVGVEWR